MPHNCKAWAKYADLERSVGETEVIVVAQRLLVIVQLLMGEIPDCSIVFTEGMVSKLAPYIKITQAVRRGDLAVGKTNHINGRDSIKNHLGKFILKKAWST